MIWVQAAKKMSRVSRKTKGELAADFLSSDANALGLPYEVSVFDGYTSP